MALTASSKESNPVQNLSLNLMVASVTIFLPALSFSSSLFMTVSRRERPDVRRESLDAGTKMLIESGVEICEV
jgi:hypothetical protein